MARKKTITREQILKAAYEVVANEGFSKFTARNIANQMNCSTQPIYLEFKNMNDLKVSLFEKIETYLRDDVFSRVITGDQLIDLNLNYIRFATEESSLYRYLYLEGHSGDEALNKFGRDIYLNSMNLDPKLKDLTIEIKNAIYTAVWIAATGIASLKSGNLISPTDDEVVTLLNNVIDGVILHETQDKKTN